MKDEKNPFWESLKLKIKYDDFYGSIVSAILFLAWGGLGFLLMKNEKLFFVAYAVSSFVALYFYEEYKSKKKEIVRLKKIIEELEDKK